MHLDDEQLQRWLDRELTKEAEPAARAHLETCAACRARVEESRREDAELHRLLRLLDHPVPDVAPRDLMSRSRPRPVSGVRWAAGIVLVAALASVAYALPGSPLRGWLAGLRETLAGPAPKAAPAASHQAGDPGIAGIAVPPGGRLVVSFDSAQARGEVVVAFTGGPEVTVRAPAGAATYDAGLDRLSIGNRGSDASYAIGIPSDAPWVEIRVAGRRIFLKQDSLVTVRGIASSGQGPFRVPLRP